MDQEAVCQSFLQAFNPFLPAGRTKIRFSEKKRLQFCHVFRLTVSPSFFILFCGFFIRISLQ